MSELKGAVSSVRKGIFFRQGINAIIVFVIVIIPPFMTSSDFFSYNVNKSSIDRLKNTLIIYQKSYVCQDNC